MPATESSVVGIFPIIWNTVRLIPKGKVATYGQVAQQAGIPRQARLVAYALHKLPPNSSIPWHRVVKSDGAIAFPSFFPLYRKQKRLLEHEGIKLHRGKVALQKFGWLVERSSLRPSGLTSA
jgi:methylated-DNA-protein-cysteine methyltransferase-like protein